jgi:hypothetical protein
LTAAANEEMDMKRIASATAIAVLFTALTGAVAFAQNAPLGDYARQARKQRQQAAPPVKTYDNDTIPRDDKLSVVGQAPETPDASVPVNSEAAAEAAKAAGKSEAGAASDQKPAETNPAPQSASGEDKKPAADAQAEKQKMFKDWQTKIAAQQAQIDELAKDLDLTTREYRLRAATFYADAGNRLRNAGQWDKEDAQFKEQIADKQKKLEDAKQALEDLREQARKAGVPSSMRE